MLLKHDTHPLCRKPQKHRDRDAQTFMVGLNWFASRGVKISRQPALIGNSMHGTWTHPSVSYSVHSLNPCTYTRTEYTWDKNRKIRVVSEPDRSENAAFGLAIREPYCSATVAHDL